ncbi:nucleotidyltransferase domain-containing protein [Candidatus Woesearchaeota archaeon]|nr:nucleotidyltransferase domain-containing protein [Candidatus Woesearchaeota archaeon]
MLTQKQLKIFEVFARNPFAEHTRGQIKKDSREKSNNSLALAINQLKREEVIIERKVGKSGLLTLNLQNDITFCYIALCNDRRAGKEVKLAVARITGELDLVTQFYSVAVFGSYAVGEQKRTSDIDIAIFVEDPEKVKLIEAAVNSAKLKILVEVDVHVIPRAEMIEMLTNDEENLGKQIARKHLAVHNHQIFYGIVLEGMKRGFRI